MEQQAKSFLALRTEHLVISLGAERWTCGWTNAVYLATAVTRARASESKLDGRRKASKRFSSFFCGHWCINPTLSFPGQGLSIKRLPGKFLKTLGFVIATPCCLFFPYVSYIYCLKQFFKSQTKAFSFKINSDCFQSNNLACSPQHRLSVCDEVCLVLSSEAISFKQRQ